MREKKTASLFHAFFPIIFLVALLIINVSIFGDDSLDGSIQIVLILSSAVATILAFNLGFTWIDIQDGILKSINSSMSSILILFLVGSLAGSWLLSGVVPAFIYMLKFFFLQPVLYVLLFLWLLEAHGQHLPQ